MLRKEITREQAKEILDNLGSDTVRVYSDNFWAYPLDLPVGSRDQGHSLMLQVMFEIERHAGVLIYIPNKELKEAANA